ncbi:6,7-dimethyl-8-ribityllumazine synthase [Histoplasma capsulatum G186AR]|uniref:6,7-dimethyl-8-ribityllumazine synthase n=1 Tax=Ajellomyces capsulatus TaxID=5037 RepID=A0A8H7YFE0_AJECA|nr:6,7-dimethyl-8-ribityllumazine synthase [Histoplasma capsulatum]QSS70979.1 6,7-dimethyl-8-ribityllumazine synthase [Histoplasma capsulatum G186AR]
MALDLKGPGTSAKHDGSDLRIAIVHARWNDRIVYSLVDGAKKALIEAGVVAENIVTQSVPGSWELPVAVESIYAASLTPTQSSPFPTPFDAIIAIGTLIKGETMHFEYIADAVSQGLMRLQLEKSVPVIFGVLTLLNEEQGLVRAGLAGGKGSAAHNHGENWGLAAVELGVKRRAWREGVFL